MFGFLFGLLKNVRRALELAERAAHMLTTQIERSMRSIATHPLLDLTSRSTEQVGAGGAVLPVAQFMAVQEAFLKSQEERLLSKYVNFMIVFSLPT